MRSVYLAGPIAGALDPVSWRVSLAKELPNGWEAQDPIKFEIGHLEPHEIVAIDLKVISKCHAVLARVEEVSWGTAMELFYSMNLGIPVIGFCLNGTHNSSPWLLHCCRVIAPSLPAALLHLAELK